MVQVFISSVSLFVFFIAFSIISSLWTNLGLLIINRDFPSTMKNINSAFAFVVAMTIVFALVVSYMGLGITKYIG